MPPWWSPSPSRRCTVGWLRRRWTPAPGSHPGEARRMACDAGLIPVVLGGKSEVLDYGRMRRLYSGPQRVAMAIRQSFAAPPRLRSPHRLVRRPPPPTLVTRRTHRPRRRRPALRHATTPSSTTPTTTSNDDPAGASGSPAPHAPPPTPIAATSLASRVGAGPTSDDAAQVTRAEPSTSIWTRATRARPRHLVRVVAARSSASRAYRLRRRARRKARRRPRPGVRPDCSARRQPAGTRRRTG